MRTPKQEFITAKDLAERWSCSTLTIRRREKEGLLKRVNLGGSIVRFRLTDIELIENAED